MSIESQLQKSGLLTGSSREFSKLSPTDRLVCLDVLENNATELTHYLRYLSTEYRKQNIEIDALQLIKDLNLFQTSTRSLN